MAIAIMKSIEDFLLVKKRFVDARLSAKEKAALQAEREDEKEAGEPKKAEAERGEEEENAAETDAGTEAE